MRRKRHKVRSMVSLLALTSVFTVGGVAAASAGDPVCLHVTVYKDGSPIVGPEGDCVSTPRNTLIQGCPLIGNQATVGVKVCYELVA